MSGCVWSQVGAMGEGIGYEKEQVAFYCPLGEQPHTKETQTLVEPKIKQYT